MSPDIDAEDIRRFIVRGTGSQMGVNESVKSLLDAIKTVVDAILVDSGTTLEAKLDAIKTVVDAILVDTGTTLEGKLDAVEGSGFSTSTDSLKVLSDVLDLIRTELTFQHQAGITFSQANPTQNQYYTVLDTTANVRIYSIAIRVATTGETVEVRITIDGQVVEGGGDLAAGTWYSEYISPGAAYYLTATTSERAICLYQAIEGRSVKIEIRKTTAAGSGTLYCNVNYAKR